MGASGGKKPQNKVHFKTRSGNCYYESSHKTLNVPKQLTRDQGYRYVGNDS